MLVDTSALMALLLNEPEASTFVRRIGRGDGVIAAPSILELHIAGRSRLGRDATQEIAIVLNAAALRVIPWSERLLPHAVHALALYGKGQHPARLNFGDCMVYAVARDLDAPLLYKGNDFAQTDIRSALA